MENVRTHYEPELFWVQIGLCCTHHHHHHQHHNLNVSLNWGSCFVVQYFFPFPPPIAKNVHCDIVVRVCVYVCVYSSIESVCNMVKWGK